MVSRLMDRRDLRDRLILRPARSSDVPEIARLEELLFPIPWSADSLLHDIENNERALVAVAEWDGCIAGYIDVWQIAGEGQMNNIGVLPEYQGQGIATQLLRYMMEWLVLCENQELTLEVRVSNEAAIYLYHREGFEDLGVRPRYYIDNGEDALLMRRNLVKEA